MINPFILTPTTVVESTYKLEMNATKVNVPEKNFVFEAKLNYWLNVVSTGKTVFWLSGFKIELFGKFAPTKSTHVFSTWYPTTITIN